VFGLKDYFLEFSFVVRFLATAICDDSKAQVPCKIAKNINNINYFYLYWPLMTEITMTKCQNTIPPLEYSPLHNRTLHAEN